MRLLSGKHPKGIVSSSHLEGKFIVTFLQRLQILIRTLLTYYSQDSYLYLHAHKIISKDDAAPCFFSIKTLANKKLI